MDNPKRGIQPSGDSTSPQDQGKGPSEHVAMAMQLLARHFVEQRESVLGAGTNATIAERVQLPSGEVICIAIGSGCFEAELVNRHMQMVMDAVQSGSDHGDDPRASSLVSDSGPAIH